MSAGVFFAWYDFWIGAYYDRKQRRLYVCTLPMICFWFQLGRASVQEEA